ncbi:MAG: AAA domain-containing protein, partial [Cyanobacteria bacterium J06555_13]
HLIAQVPQRFDMNRQSVQQTALSLSALPLGRWPANPDRHLSLQQQCAVNIALRKNAKAGLFSVNGPPGTGKTTMLRDIIADILVQRAARMVAFDTPNNAFSEPKTIGGKVSPTSPYLIDSSLTGYEIVVASSNNGAVENISKELPDISAIAPEYRSSIGHFSETARSVLQADAWGLVSAVLGNKKNRQNFAQLFWNETQESTSPVDFSSALAPPFVLNWQKTQQAFCTIKREVETIISQRQGYERAVASHMAARQRLHAAQQQFVATQQDAIRHRQNQQHVEGRLTTIQEQLRIDEANLQLLTANKPSLGRRILSIFAKQSAVESYHAQQQQAHSKLENLKNQLREEQVRDRKLRRILLEVAAQLQQLQQQLAIARDQLSAVENKLEEGRLLLGEAFADASWWNRPTAAVQMSVPWIDAVLDDARSRLFIAAMQVHQSFIEQAADKVYKNMSLWVTLLEEGYPASRNKNHAITLWQSAFLVIPVISTAFASVENMFKLLQKEAIGWLLIDEAGQAVPQSAIGAMWRAKRVVAVGDPLQLEPVFTLQPAVVEGLRQHFQLKDCWNPLSYSVQGLADRVNPYGAEIKQQGKPLWIGCPLRVHRRCIEPMFSISNQIAYGGTMILAT